MKQTLKLDPTPTEWNPNALWAKSLRYAATMLERKGTEWKWEYAFWSSLLLEHLARTALANVHPSLLADIEKSNIPYQLHYALGLSVNQKGFFSKSIPISQVFCRLKVLFENFTSEDVCFCNEHMKRRNSEVHTGKISFENLSDSSWQPQFYKACKILLKTMDMNLIDLFGEDESNIAEQLILTNADKNASKVRSDVENHKKIWQDKSEDEKQILSQKTTLWATKERGHQVKCPACESKSLVFGEPVGEVKTKLEGDIVIEQQECLPNAFECIACGLKIFGLSKLIAIDLGDRFTNTSAVTHVDDPALEDYGWHHPFEDDNNEPFDL